jgi:hypothetical protein
VLHTPFLRVRVVLLPGLFLAFLNVNPLTQARTSAVALDDWTIECVDCPKYFDNLSNRSAVLDSNDLPHVAYGGDHLYYGYLDVGGEWHSEVVDDSPRVGFGAALALDSNEHPHILYYDSANSAFKYARHDGIGWIIEAFPAGSLANPHISLAIDSSDRLNVSFYNDVAGDLIYGVRVGSGWYFEAVDSDENVGKYSSITLDGDDLPHISYRDGTNSQLKYALFDGAEWIIQSLIGDGCDTDIAIDQNGYAHIVHQGMGVTGISALIYRFEDISGWHLEIVDESEIFQMVVGVGYYNSIGLDTEGEPHVSYSGQWQTYSTYPFVDGYDLRYAHRTNSGWEIESIDTNNARNSSIMIDNSGDPSVIFKGQNRLRYTRRSDLGFTEITNLDWSEFVGLSSSLDMVFLDQPHVSYYDTEGYIVKHAQRNPIGWSATTIDGAGWKASNNTPLSLSPNGYPHILYAQYVRWPYESGLHHTYFDGETWVGDIVDEDCYYDYDCIYASTFNLKVDLQGDVHVFVNSAYLFKDDNWSEPEPILSPSGSFTPSSITTGSSGKVHVALTGDGLVYSYKESGDWFFEEVDAGGASFASIVLDSNENPHISYYDATNGDLKYAKFNGTTWEIETIDTVGDVGSYSSLGIDHLDLAHIAYYDATNGDLKYAHYNGSEWEINALVSEGDVGSHCSLVLDPFGNPYISYHDADLGDLMIIYKPHGTLHQLILPMISR